MHWNQALLLAAAMLSMPLHAGPELAVTTADPQAATTRQEFAASCRAASVTILRHNLARAPRVEIRVRQGKRARLLQDPGLRDVLSRPGAAYRLNAVCTHANELVVRYYLAERRADGRIHYMVGRLDIPQKGDPSFKSETEIDEETFWFR